MRSLIAILVLCSALLGCGVPGAPLPPSLDIPKFVGDLKAVRKGETVTLAWTTPTETTDGELIRKPGKLLVQRALTSDRGGDLNFQTISELPLEPALKDGRGDQVTAKDTLTDALRSGGAEFAVYSVLAQGHNGKSFGLPNRVSVPLLQSLPAPHNVSAHLVQLGVMLKWEEVLPPASPSQTQQFKVMRRQQGSNDAVLVKQLNASAYGDLVDNTIDWEKTYQYWITPVTLWQEGNRKDEVEGEDSAVVEILAHDSFPPAAPTGLQAVFSSVSSAPQNSFIDLTWTPNIENDLMGYNVYRHTANAAPVKINSELVKTPRFPDPGIQPGMKYFYSVTAVDLRGNESGKSEETSETVPKD